MAVSHFVGCTHHCAMFKDDSHSAITKGYKECRLHPEHEKFMTVDYFKQNGSSEYGFNDISMSIIQNNIDRTVRVKLTHVSAKRPDSYKNSKTPYPCIDERGSCNWIRYGTGFLIERYSYDSNKPCPCPDCPQTDQTTNLKSFYFVVKTASHVVYDEQEAQSASFEFFYDSTDRSTVKTIYGVTVIGPDHLRWETDKCIVLCVTHDESLADQLGLLCDPTESLARGVLVSHPHGVSKRISVDVRPRCTLRMIPNKTSVLLKKDAEIKFFDCHDTEKIVQDINRVLGDGTIGFDCQSNRFILQRDLNIFDPLGIVIEVDYPAFNWKLKLLDKSKKKWWKLFSPSAMLVTDDGKQYTFPSKDDERPNLMVKIGVFEKFQYFFDDHEIDTFTVFTFSYYKMASCPGCSGAHVRSREDFSFISETGGVHFGNSGEYNTSCLICVQAPVNQERSDTGLGNPLMGTEDERENLVFYSIVAPPR